jgi:hypothetical protein
MLYIKYVTVSTLHMCHMPLTWCTTLDFVPSSYLATSYYVRHRDDCYGSLFVFIFPVGIYGIHDGNLALNFPSRQTNLL